MADAFVRPTLPTDAAELGRIQTATYAVAYGDALPPEALAAVSPTAAAEAWRAAAERPPSAGHRVLTAYERHGQAETIVGFAAVAPVDTDEPGTEGPTAELVALLVEPRWGRRGHGSRLLAAAVDVARTSGAQAMVAWVLDADRASDGLLASAGWERDGWTRSLETGGAPIGQHRLSADIRP